MMPSARQWCEGLVLVAGMPHSHMVPLRAPWHAHNCPPGACPVAPGQSAPQSPLACPAMPPLVHALWHLTKAHTPRDLVWVVIGQIGALC